MGQSIDNIGGAAFGNSAFARDRSRETQSFRGIMIGIALSAVLWAPVGIVALRLL